MMHFAAMIAAGAITALSQRPAARAAEPPWCLISGFGGERCSYGSLDACLRDRAGGGGFCNPNPRYHGSASRGGLR